MGFVEGLQGSVHLDEKKKLHLRFQQPLTDAHRPQINGVSLAAHRDTILTSDLLGRCYDHLHFTWKAKGGRDGMITQGATAHKQQI